ncbi:MAG: hypothetical protein HYR56_19305 [Acidobacteria bacterium]|nr:hypothetical protein [Acidobacteriota bacterium]MBI3426147.1 hypothetical protein [Acidobacteriota bacterium]
MTRQTGKTADTLTMLTIAFMAGEGKLQNEIASDLGLSQATVSRLLAKARATGYLKAEVRFVHEKVAPATLQEIRVAASRKKLEVRLNELMRQHSARKGLVLREFPSGSQETTDEAWAKRLQEFSQRAAPFVRQLLMRAKLCGVSWGETLGVLIAMLAGPPLAPPRSNAAPNAIPLCGEPLGQEPNHFSSSNLAALLEKFYTGDDRATLSLGMVPAFIPTDFNAQEMSVVWRLLESVNDYELIFGHPSGEPVKHQPYVEKLDMILTSVGPAQRLLGYRSAEWLKKKFNLRMLEKLVLGDIAGVLIPRLELNQKAKEKVRQVNARWTGIQQKHLVACAQRAEQNNLPGVVCFAAGKNKAPFALEAVKLGLINVLIVDDDLEDELERLIS